MKTRKPKCQELVRFHCTNLQNVLISVSRKVKELQ